MLNTIFKKQFFSYIGALILSFLLLGVSLSQVFKNFFIQRKLSTLKGQGAAVCKMVENWVNTEDNKGKTFDIRDLEILYVELRNLEKYLDIGYVVLDENFYIIKFTDQIIRSLDSSIKMPEITELKQGIPAENIQNLGGLFKDDVLVVGSPIMINDRFSGAILMSSSIPEIEKSARDITKVTVLLLLASGGFAFIWVYISSKTISKPLYELNEAAKVIASGDFEKRLRIKSKDEVGQLADSFNSMAESLSKQEMQRRMFLSNISHDLRSPLTSMSGFLQAIIDGTIPKESQDKYLKIVLEETKRLSKLANDILDINNLKIIEIEPTEFDVNELIRRTVIQFEKRIVDKNIDFRVTFAEDRTFVFADEEKIQRVIYNLLDNALKFTSENDKIIIETIKKDKKLYISVRDTGIGISKEDQKYVFERFYKADTSRGMDKKGSGLGLAIIKEFIKAHGEALTLISEKDEFTEFIFSLTLAQNKII